MAQVLRLIGAAVRALVQRSDESFKSVCAFCHIGKTQDVHRVAGSMDDRKNAGRPALRPPTSGHANNGLHLCRIN